MSTCLRLHTRVTDYLAERRRLGFELQSHDTLLADFAQFVADRQRTAQSQPGVCRGTAVRNQAGDARPDNR